MCILKKSIVDEKIQRLIADLRKDQSPNGSWNYPFETGISTDAYMIILLRTLEINDEELIQELVKRIFSKQEKNGAWALFKDEGDGNITITTEAYYALLYSGYVVATDERLKSAKQFILSKGGIAKTHPFAKIMLSLTGQHRWPTFFPIPVEIMLLPLSFPINFFSFSVYGRANLCPIMILACKKFQIRTAMSPDLSDLFTSRDDGDYEWNRSPEWQTFFSILQQSIKNLIGIPERIHNRAISQAKQYMLDHIEPDGTCFSYFSSTFLMIFALLALKIPKDDPIIAKAIEGLKSMKTQINGQTHIQYTTASVWNTSLVNFAFQQAGVSQNDPMVVNANQYLRNRQHHKFGDWRIHNLTGKPGGWGFSDVNTINPDVDDTTAALRAIKKSVKEDAGSRLAWEKGVQWVISMQNDDGGWAAFERNTYQKWLNWLPVEMGNFLPFEPSTADLTGRTLEFFGAHTTLSKKHPIIRRGILSLLGQQEKNGSWYGRWGICYIYGTWAAVTGLKANGVPSNHHSIFRARKWLEDIQNSDGGWGESCKSDSRKSYVPLGASTLSHTSWALDALIAVSAKSTTKIEKGIDYLIHHLEKMDWTTVYPTGQGMAGDFYILYHSYRYIFPLLTLAHYHNKFLV
jgi:sporulenol synthase